MPQKKPTLSLTAAATRRLLTPVRRAGARFALAYPGESGARQPVHTLYGGAQLYRFDSVPKLGALALKSFAEHAPSPGALSAAVGLESPEGEAPAEFAAEVHARVKAKLEREPVEDFRIDFEDGYGNRPDAEEDGHAHATAAELARGLAEGTLLALRRHPHQAALARARRARAAHARPVRHDARARGGAAAAGLRGHAAEGDDARAGHGAGRARSKHSSAARGSPGARCGSS